MHGACAAFRQEVCMIVSLRPRTFVRPIRLSRRVLQWLTLSKAPQAERRSFIEQFGDLVGHQTDLMIRNLPKD